MKAIWCTVTWQVMVMWNGKWNMVGEYEEKAEANTSAKEALSHGLKAHLVSVFKTPEMVEDTFNVMYDEQEGYWRGTTDFPAEDIGDKFRIFSSNDEAKKFIDAMNRDL